jgi:hypothetical protein
MDLDLASLKRTAIEQGCTFAQLKGKTAAAIRELVAAQLPAGTELAISGAGHLPANGYYRRNGFWNAKPTWSHVEDAHVIILYELNRWYIGYSSDAELGNPAGLSESWFCSRSESELPPSLPSEYTLSGTGQHKGVQLGQVELKWM